METKFRPVPITILDFLGILLPGFVWFVLLATTFEIFLGAGVAPSSPVAAWLKLTESMKGWDGWLAPLTVVFASLLLGYIIKPMAMDVINVIGRPFFWFSKHRGIPLRSLKFPYKAIFERKYYYPKVRELLRRRLDCDPERLPGTAPFSAAKRFLRLTAPSLWEESERMEAEVRMTGALFLAALYSGLLSLLTLIIWQEALPRGELKVVWVWLTLSALMSLVLGRSVNLLRVREVSYAYLNALIALKCLPRNTPASNAAGGDEGDEE